MVTELARTRLEAWSAFLATATVVLVILSAVCAIASYVVDRRLKAEEAGRLRSLQQTADTTGAQAAAAAARAESASQHVATLQADVRQKNEQITELQKRAGRRLTAEELRELVRTLSRAPSHSIVIASQMGNGESIQYAEDLVKAFAAAKWQPERNLMSMNAFSGVSLMSRLSTGDELDGAGTIREAFRAAGIPLLDPVAADIRSNSIGALRGGTLILVVGRNPN